MIRVSEVRTLSARKVRLAKPRREWYILRALTFPSLSSGTMRQRSNISPTSGPLTYIRILQHPGINNDKIDPLQSGRAPDPRNKALQPNIKSTVIPQLRLPPIKNARTSTLSSTVTSHSSMRSAPGRADSCHRSPARNWSRTVAITLSPRASSCRANSRPSPRLAPTMSHVCGIFWSVLGGRFEKRFGERE